MGSGCSSSPVHASSSGSPLRGSWASVREGSLLDPFAQDGIFVRRQLVDGVSRFTRAGVLVRRVCRERQRGETERVNAPIDKAELGFPRLDQLELTAVCGDGT